MKFLISLFVLCLNSGFLNSHPRFGRLSSKKVELKEAPFMVRLEFSLSIPNLCGGAIIKPSYVVTAASCTGKTFGTLNSVVAGTVGHDKENSHSQRRGIVNVLIHPEYNYFFESDKDIALLELNKPFDFNEYVQAINIASPGFEAAGDATLYGWEFSITLSRQLTATRKTITKCDAGDYGFLTFLASLFLKGDLICSENSLIDCKLMSSDVLVQNETLVGITMNHPRQCALFVPSIYIKVSSYNGWLNDNMKTTTAVTTEDTISTDTDGASASTVPDGASASTVPDGASASTVPDGASASTVPDGASASTVPDAVSTDSPTKAIK